jgi:hypothetical protein
VRYGVADRQYGADEIAAAPGASVGAARPAAHWPVVIAVDDRAAAVSTLFGYPVCLPVGRRRGAAGAGLADRRGARVGDPLADPSGHRLRHTSGSAA